MVSDLLRRCATALLASAAAVDYRKKVFETANAVLSAARDLGISQRDFEMVGPARWRSVMDAILGKFTTQAGPAARHNRWLWSTLIEPTYTVSTEGMPDLAILAGLGAQEEHIYLLLEDWDSTNQHAADWLFRGTIGACIKVLGEQHPMEFCMVGRGLKWLLAENHHNMWIGAGAHAIAFLREAEATST